MEEIPHGSAKEMAWEMVKVLKTCKHLFVGFLMQIIQKLIKDFETLYKPDNSCIILDN